MSWSNYSPESDGYLPVKHVAGTGHTYRMKSSARHKSDPRFRGKPQLHKYIRHSKIPDFSDINDVIDSVISDGIDLAENLLQFDSNNNLLSYSLSKKKRWLLPDMVTKAIDELNNEENAYDVSIGTRHNRPVERWRTHNCSSFHSTVGNAENPHFYSRHERRFADPKSLIINVSRENTVRERHDWKPELQKLTHNQHFRGVQRKELLQNGYRRSLREILKSAAKDKIEAEQLALVVIQKPEVVYDVEYPTPAITYDPNLQKDCTLSSKYKRPDVNRLNTLRGANASKHSQILRTEFEESYSILSDWESTAPSLGEAENLHLLSTSFTERSTLKLGDFIAPAKKRRVTRSKRVPLENHFKYEPISFKTKDLQSLSPNPVEDDSGISNTSTDNSQSEYLPTSQPPKLEYRTVIVVRDQLSSSNLAKEFGHDYSEGNSHPRRFTLCLSGKSCPSPSYLVFQVIDEFEVGLAEVLVRLHTNGDAEGFLSELPECSNLLTIGDMVSSGKLHMHESDDGNSISRKVTPPVDMKRLNQTLGSKLSLQPGQEACRLIQAAVIEPENRQSVLSGNRVESDSWTYLTDVVQCEICYNECSGEAYENRWTRLKDCGHVYCNNCWCQHLTYCIRRGDRQLLCPAHSCDSEVEDVTVLSLVGGAAYRLLEKRSLETMIDKSLDWRWCPNNRCGRVAHKRKADERLGLNISCDCGHLWCYCCQGAAHWPATCQQAERYADNLKEVGFALATYTIPISSVKVKRCPSCRYPVEKFQGCNMMMCSLCKTSYCWLCLRPAGLVHNCNEQLEEDIDLVDVVPHAMRWFEVACERRLRWQAQKLHFIDMIKKSHGLRNRYRPHLKRFVLRTTVAGETLSTLRLYNHVIEHITVVWMSCQSKAVKHQFKLKFNEIKFVAESLEKILVEACIRGKLVSGDKERIGNLIKFGDKSLLFIRLQMGHLQHAIRALNKAEP